MRGANRPTTGCMCGFNRVTNILAITLTYLPDHSPFGIIYIAAIATIRPHLFAADKHFRRSINRVKR
jgi:hypothetical protein